MSGDHPAFQLVDSVHCFRRILQLCDPSSFFAHQSHAQGVPVAPFLRFSTRSMSGFVSQWHFPCGTQLVCSPVVPGLRRWPRRGCGQWESNSWGSLMTGGGGGEKPEIKTCHGKFNKSKQWVADWRGIQCHDIQWRNYLGPNCALTVKLKSCCIDSQLCCETIPMPACSVVPLSSFISLHSLRGIQY